MDKSWARRLAATAAHRVIAGHTSRSGRSPTATISRGQAESQQNGKNDASHREPLVCSATSPFAPQTYTLITRREARGCRIRASRHHLGPPPLTPILMFGSREPPSVMPGICPSHINIPPRTNMVMSSSPIAPMVASMIAQVIPNPSCRAWPTSRPRTASVPMVRPIGRRRRVASLSHRSEVQGPGGANVTRSCGKGLRRNTPGRFRHTGCMC